MVGNYTRSRMHTIKNEKEVLSGYVSERRKKGHFRKYPYFTG